MKYKNYKSAIHNFTHSFISVDYLKSHRLAINVLIDLNILHEKTESTFDFIKNEITPKESDTEENRELLNDYLKWLPEHFKNHNCDYSQLEKLELKFWVDFDKGVTPPKMKNTIQYSFTALTRWKVYGKNEEIIEICQEELMNKGFLNNRMPEFK